MMFLGFDVFTRRWFWTGHLRDAVLLAQAPTVRKGRLVRLRFVR